MNMTHYMQLLADNQPWNLLIFMVVPVVLAETVAVTELFVLFRRAGSGALVTYAERPDRLRNEASLQGLTQVQAYDGKEGWQIQPFGGRKDPEKLSADDVKGLADSADMDGPLVDWRAKGHQVEYLGTEDVDGTEAHKLKVTQRNGDIKYIYLDPDYFLQIRETVTRTVRGTEQRFETDMGNYEQVAGVYMPFAYESGAAGGPKDQKITVQKIEVNVPIDDALFAFPSAPATPAQ